MAAQSERSRLPRSYLDFETLTRTQRALRNWEALTPSLSEAICNSPLCVFTFQTPHEREKIAALEILAKKACLSPTEKEKEAFLCMIREIEEIIRITSLFMYPDETLTEVIDRIQAWKAMHF